MNKVIVSVVSALTGAAAGAGITGRKLEEKWKTAQSYADKHLALFLMMNQWVKVKQEGKSLVSFFEKQGYKRIAIYGLSYAGETLLGELRGSEVEVAYGIDSNTERMYADINIISPDAPFEEVDAIVVTAITFFDEIEEKLSKKANCPIVSLEDILYEV